MDYVLMMWGKITTRIFFITLILFKAQFGTAEEPKTCPFLDTCKPNVFIDYLNTQVDEVENQVSPKGRVKKAAFALEQAENCVKRFPDEAGCYFYRAVLRGLYIETTGLGYQKALVQMVKDAKKVLEMNPTYDAGGAYRLLGNIYLKVPGMALAEEGIIKDADQAYQYALQAMALSPEHPDNRQLLGEVLMEQGKKEEARGVLEPLLAEYEKKSPKTLHDKEVIRDLQKLLAKISKKS
ncbi:tetratricopeptide repeat protein [bacterium]|nr:tetratricopeptide repeat protein [bacterium]